jgi:UDP-N-acetyl-D-mannosaminuronic acid dehydrogenase
MMKNASYDVCIIRGLGHIGLPLEISLANSGKNVVLYDTNERFRNIVSAGKMPFLEAGAEEVLRDVLNRTLLVSCDRKVIAESYYVIIAIGTPVDEHLNPQFTTLQEMFF